MITEKNQNLMCVASDYTVVDIETTGLNPYTCDIIEIAALRVQGYFVVNRFHSYLHLPYSVPRHIVELTGITDKMLLDAPQKPDVLKAFCNFIGNDILVGHNL